MTSDKKLNFFELGALGFLLALAVESRHRASSATVDLFGYFHSSDYLVVFKPKQAGRPHR